MSSQKPLLVVLGATGTQGGSVLSCFLSLPDSPYALRGVTRDPSSPKSASLASLGVEMVAGDFDDPASLDAAFEGAAAIFSVTDFWQYFASPTIRERASVSGQSIGVFCREYEAQQNRDIIDAAAKVGKAIAEEYGKSAYPELWKKTSVLYGGYYLENWLGPLAAMFSPVLNKSKDTLVLSLAEPVATKPLPLYSGSDDTGALVQALLCTAPGKKLIGVKDWLSYRDFAKVLAKVLGKGIEFNDRTPSFDLGDPDLEKDHADLTGFWVECRYDGGKVNKSVVQPADLGVPVRLASVKEWCQKQDWEKHLQVVE